MRLTLKTHQVLSGLYRPAHTAALLSLSGSWALLELRSQRLWRGKPGQHGRLRHSLWRCPAWERPQRSAQPPVALWALDLQLPAEARRYGAQQRQDAWQHLVQAWHAAVGAGQPQLQLGPVHRLSSFRPALVLQKWPAAGSQKPSTFSISYIRLTMLESVRAQVFAFQDIKQPQQTQGAALCCKRDLGQLRLLLLSWLTCMFGLMAEGLWACLLGGLGQRHVLLPASVPLAVIQRTQHLLVALSESVQLCSFCVPTCALAQPPQEWQHHQQSWRLRCI